MNKIRRVVCPGSFDPPTVGHIDVIKRASEIFDEVLVLVSFNSEKKYLFSPDERKLLLEDAVSAFSKVKVDVYNGLITEYAVKNGYQALVKGVRNALDYSYENELCEINRNIGKHNFDSPMETILIPARSELSYISSTMVRELIKYGANLSACVPNEELLLKILASKK